MPNLTVKEKIRTCVNCELHKGCNGPVPYSGRPADIMVIGEAPGRNEDEQGKPFVGPAGKLLWAELKRAGVDRSEVNIMRANAVCCFPHGTPNGDQIYACRSNLYDQIRLCHPKHILALGRTANWSLGQQKETITAMRGKWYSLHWFVNGVRGYEKGELIPVMPTFHPAAIMRNKTLTRKWREDLKAFAAEVTT